jgi:hypothetical protein
MINGLIVETKVLDFVMGEMNLKRGILFPDWGNLYITTNGDHEVVVMFLDQMVASVKRIVREIEVPKTILGSALRLLVAKRFLDVEYQAVTDLLVS